MAQIQLRGGHSTTDPRLDRIPQWDARNLSYPVTQDPKYDPTPRNRTWPLKLRLDQGQEGACTGFSRSHDLAAQPKPAKDVTNATAQKLYKLAQELDEYPGTDYEGSSVLGAVKAAVQEGYIGEYRWATSIDDVLGALGSLGGVVIGSDWPESAFTPRPDGTLDMSGATAGGHAYYLRGSVLPKNGRVKASGFKVFKASEPLVRITNSWGEGWGHGGEALIFASDLERLLRAGGEAAVTTKPFALKN